VKGHPSISINPRYKWASVPPGLCFLEPGVNHTEKEAIDASDPDRQGVNPFQLFTLLTHDSSGTNSLKHLIKKIS